jgi:hypothetical protein
MASIPDLAKKGDILFLQGWVGEDCILYLVLSNFVDNYVEKSVDIEVLATNNEIYNHLVCVKAVLHMDNNWKQIKIIPKSDLILYSYWKYKSQTYFDLLD